MSQFDPEWWELEIERLTERERQLETELAAANTRIKDIEARGIHSCHDGCQRLECRQRRRIEELLAACEAASEYFGASLHPVAAKLRAAISRNLNQQSDATLTSNQPHKQRYY